MPRPTHDPATVDEFILHHLDDHPASIVALAMQRFSYSRATVTRIMQKLAQRNLLSFHGNTFARRYSLKPLAQTAFTLEVTHRWSESEIWRDRIAPLMKNIDPRVVSVCQYGFTEMLNNVIDHARSPDVIIAYRQDYNHVGLLIADRGVGIFKKIQNDFHLDDPRTALLELSKGKLTSDKKNHAGEGIYFTSRAFDRFRIRSGNLFYSRERRDADGWLIEVNDRRVDRPGTIVTMRIRTDADWTLRDIFDKYQGDNLRFRKTHVPIKLAQYPGEQLVSRSQAKRLLARFDHFSEVFLDFSDIEEIGQGFADEIFRVYRDAHPGTGMAVSNANTDVRRMIEFVGGRKITPDGIID